MLVGFLCDLFFKGYGMEEGVFCGVFDGHGRYGHTVSKLVRDYLPSLIISQHNAVTDNDYYNHDDDDNDSSDDDDENSGSIKKLEDWKDACVNAFKAMDKDLKNQIDLDCSCSGSTAVTIIKQGKELIIANLGDSRAVLGTISEEGYLMAVQLTTDLKPNLPQEAERIKKSNGRVFALRDEPNIHRVWLPNENFPGLAMARAFGDLHLKNYGVIAVPQISCRSLTSRDQFLVLATDGVWDVLSNEKVVSIVHSAENSEEAAKAVVEAAVRAWRCKFPSSRVDDCSAICLFLQESKHGEQP
ncbi:putative protein phosphatase 2C 12 [Acorus gramineus]|uniref:protein-serine/threonine phosphatase n=1 Tax=Acorus gramineus TaxID=55184 RepID=A0AAV9ASG1_ACOGR|nr:putative protein phosphatase 2C 12 [Acorus gramineus]